MMSSRNSLAKSLAANIDLYGTYARTTYLADYLEMRALCGDDVRLSLLADLIKDRGWGRRDLYLVTPQRNWVDPDVIESELGKFDDESEDVVASISAVLRARVRHAGERYPFRIVGDGTGAKLVPKRLTWIHFPYLAFLGLTIAHAYNVPLAGLRASSVEDAFEEIVAHCLRDYGMPAVVVPTYDDDIRVKIPETVLSLSLRPEMTLGTFANRAKDAGTDIIAHLPTTDTRQFPCFVFIGQATCGRTNTWQAKAVQANTAAWRRILQIDYDPHPFLAIPHHVDQRYWPWLMQESRTPIMDRVRLLAMSGSTTLDGLHIVRTIFGIETRQKRWQPRATKLSLSRRYLRRRLAASG